MKILFLLLQFVITSFGAVNDSTIVQTEAIQNAVDAAAVKGGTVVIPRGVWLSGAIFFKPGTHLLLEEGAVLKGSTDVADFPDIPVHIEGVLQPYVSALINADRCDGFTISGSGTLDGNGLPYWKAFWARRKEIPACTNLEVRRPRMIGISNSSDITIEGIHLRNSAFWNIHLYKCRKVKVYGVDIFAPVKPVRAPSSDGIDLDACEDVHIRGCSFATCDDLIAIKGGKGPWADTDPDNGPVRNVLVEDCHFGHGPGVLVFGSECVKADSIVLRNSTVDGTDRLVWLKMRPDTPQRYSHVLVENVKGRVKFVFFVKPWTQFFDLKGRKDIPKSYASDIQIRNNQLRCRRYRLIEEAPDQYELENIVFDGNKIKRDTNTDEKKVGAYTLPDPLVFANGRPVADKDDWKARRKEILSIFQKEMYGAMPKSSPLYLEVLKEEDALDGAAMKREVRMRFMPDGKGPHVDWLILYPKKADRPVPAIISLNYYGNDTVLDNDALVRVQGKTVTVYPLEEIISRGYAFATACYEDVSADPDDPAEQQEQAFGGVFELWKRDPARTDNTGSLMAWAWALCRGLGMLEKDDRVDASKVVVTGCSRLGKAALLAAAFDEHFAAAVINQTGGGGVPLAKRNFGEHVASETEMFTHWWCKAFSKYIEAEKKMPFDQHMLVSCIAPRPLLVEGFNNSWFDTHGEFLALQAASPVWRFLGGEGLPDVPWPDNMDTSAIGHDLGYVRRPGAHGINADDWKWMLDFADQALPAVPDRPRVDYLGPLQGEQHRQHGFAYQGMDISGRYMLSCQNQGAASVYKLSGKSFERVGQFRLASFHKYNHANVVSFGVEKASKGDPLPVAYISQCHRKPVGGRKDVLYAERIKPGFGGSELVQTIFYDDVNHDFGYALQWVIDTKEKMLYGYGNTIDNTNPANRHRIVKFRLPRLSDGPFVVLKPEDALENYTIEEVSGYSFNPIGQGLYIHKGKLYMPTGFGWPEAPSILYIWDLENHSMTSVDLSLSTCGELEDISRFGNYYYIQSQDGVFRVKL